MAEKTQEKAPLFVILDNLRLTKENLLEERPELMDSYEPFIINRFLSSSIGNIFYVQDMNMYGSVLTKDQQYLYYLGLIPKSKKWLSYPKRDKVEAIVNYVMEYYGYSKEKAEIAVSLLNDSQVNEIIEKFEKHLKK
jgi:hypothetical protein